MSQIFTAQPHSIDIAETDLAGLVHFSHYLRFVESAERQFLTELDIPVITQHECSIQGFPRRHSSCDYLAPIHFNDQIQVELSIERIGDHSIQYHFEIINRSVSPRISAASGQLVVLFAQINPASHQITLLEIPPVWKKKLSPFLLK